MLPIFKDYRKMLLDKYVVVDKKVYEEMKQSKKYKEI